MPINLDKSISWMNADAEERRMLDRLQGNILKGHGRHFTSNLFFRIDPAKPKDMRGALREIATTHMRSAWQQLDEAREFRKSGRSGGPFVALFLSHHGYLALGVPKAEIPSDPSFAGGMQRARLGDAPVSDWESGFRDPIDGMVLIGADEGEVEPTARTIAALLTRAGGSILKDQRGKAIFNEAGEGIEHFGYVDGRSQPLTLLEDVATELYDGGIDAWNPGAPLKVALVADPGAPDGVSFGSYFIFRKLSQDVLGFKTREQDLADVLRLGDRELAGAYVVGRFEDGTPVTDSGHATGGKPPNNFNYKQDAAGARCPFHAHIRKTNPRGSGGFESEKEEFAHLMLRRGIPYEDVKRKREPKDLDEAPTRKDFEQKVAPYLPSGGVGLLFMAYNREIAAQFEFTQVNWANNPDFPKNGKPSMLDTTIGQPAGQGLKQHWPKVYDDHTAGEVEFAFADYVAMRGGEYFFAPSLTVLRGL